MGRSFLSPGGMGIYLSILLRPECTADRLMHLTCATAVAACDAVEYGAGFRPKIKWTNDLVSQNRKLAGILTEMGMDPSGAVSYVVVGIGINCCQNPLDFPPELRDMAGSLSMIAGKPISREKVMGALLRALWEMDQKLLLEPYPGMEQYRRDCMTLGQEISLIRGDKIRHGLALNVDDQGALVVRFVDGHTETVNSGEVSVRGLYGYV